MWTAETVLVCALALLPRSVGSFPPIVLAPTRPPFASATADGWVITGDQRIYLLTSSPAFRLAMSAQDRCGELTALKRIASVIVHEEWHVRNSPGEEGAYVAQLTALTAMHSGPGTPLYTEVWRARRAATRRAPQSASATPAP